MWKSKSISIFRKGRSHWVFVNFPVLIQLIHDQFHLVTFFTWRKKWGGKRKPSFPLFLCGLCMEGSASTAVFLLLSHVCSQGLSVSSLTMIKDSTKVLLSWENHYFYEVRPILYLRQLLPKGKTQGIISCTCRYNCTLLCIVALKALEGFKCRNELSLKILVYWFCTASLAVHAALGTHFFP